MTFRLGLTGSIGMGKSTTAKLFAEKGCAVWDADMAVGRLYDKNGAGVSAVAALNPRAIVDGVVSKEVLKEIIFEDPEFLTRLEKIIHPLVAQDREAFVKSCQADIAVFDIPLLFEKGTQSEMDAVVCVSTDAKTQKARVMARNTMTEAQFHDILARQMPDAEKRRLADYVVITDNLEQAEKEVETIVSQIRKRFV